MTDTSDVLDSREVGSLVLGAHLLAGRRGSLDGWRGIGRGSRTRSSRGTETSQVLQAGMRDKLAVRVLSYLDEAGEGLVMRLS